MKREVDAQDQPSIKDGDGFMRPAKRKRVSTSSLAVEGLPNAQRYEVSYMHRDVVTHVAVARKSEFILTASRDGHVKFWRKMPTSIEFVKHFVAHLERLVSFVVSSDDQRLLTASTDGMAKIFDVVAFDMTAMIDLGFIPSYATWLNDIKIVAADSKAPVMRVFDLESDGGGSCLQELKIHHSQPVASIAFNAASKAMISVDTKGIIEYWDNENSFELLNSDNRSKLSFG
jgi:peptidylprolyl isomerase domain and WD repeat-containing protein 1